MIGTTIRRLATSANPANRGAAKLLARHTNVTIGRVPTKKLFVQASATSSDTMSTALRPRAFSSSTTETKSGTGFVERPLEALDMAVVRQIKAELMEVDANSDGRYVHACQTFRIL